MPPIAAGRPRPVTYVAQAGKLKIPELHLHAHRSALQFQWVARNVPF
jgi:hypothetical protein